MSAKKIIAILIPLVKVVKMRKGCRVREGRFRRYGLKFKVTASKWKIGKSCFIHSSEGLRKHVWGALGNQVIPGWVTIDFSVSPVICNPCLTGLIKLKGGGEEWEILKTDLCW